MTRVHNFSAGPATLPLPVIERIAEELPEWDGAGMSVMEMSHRGKAFMSIAERAEADLRRLLAIPDGYHVLFVQGGAQLQFSAVPLNLLRGRASADYVDTGSWSAKAIAEAGLSGVWVPKEYGGEGGGVLNLCLVVEQFSRACGGMPPAGSWRPRFSRRRRGCAGCRGFSTTNCARRSGMRPRR